MGIKQANQGCNVMTETERSEEFFKKSEHTKEAVEREAQIRLAAGAVSSTVEDRGEDWVLVTIEETESTGPR